MRTPSRLHFGMVDMRGDLGRVHCSVGVAIDKPNVILKAEPAPTLYVKGTRAERARQFAEKILMDSGVKGAANLELASDIREHAGFGSGTQLALAVGTALSKIYDLGLTTEEIALRLHRSMRSGVGTYAFMHGGFIVDGGHRADDKEGIPPLLFRADVPEDWLFVIGIPETTQRHSGAIENEAFKMLRPPPASLVSEISRIVLVQIMPAILERDIKAFGAAMTSIDYKFGEFWLEIQGGRFSNPTIEAGVEFLLEAGAYGVGQSSWGPAFYGLVNGEAQAKVVSGRLSDFLNSGGRSGEVFIAGPDNKGAVVTVSVKDSS